MACRPVRYLFISDNTNREFIQLFHRGSILHAIVKNCLPVKDYLGSVSYTGQERTLCHPIYEFITISHSTENRIELQVLDQVRSIPRKILLKVEVPVTIHQVNVHYLIRSLKESYVRLYFSASAVA